MTTDTDLLAKMDSEYSEDEFPILIHEAFTRCRWIAADDMVGIMELADIFAIGRSTVTNWAANRSRNGMPEPIKRLGSGPIYSLTEVLRWWVNWTPIKSAKVGMLAPSIIAEYRVPS